MRTALALLVALTPLVACAQKTVLVGGREVPYEAAAQDAFNAAKSAADRGDFKTAEQGFSDVLNRFPASPLAREAARQLGLAQLKLGHAADAVQTLRPVVEDASGDSRVQVTEAAAQAAEASGQFHEAARWRWQLVDAAPDEGKAAALAHFVELVDSKVPFNDIAKLAEEIPRASAAWPPVALKLARVYVHLGDRGRAVSLLDDLDRRLGIANDGGSEPGGWRPTASPADGGGPVPLSGDEPLVTDVKILREQLQSQGSGKPGVIGVLLPLSGRFAAYGKSVLDGLSVILPLDGSGDIRVVVKDTKGEPDEAMRMVESLAREDGVIAVIGPIGSAESAPAAARAEELGLPMVSLSRVEGIPAIGPHIFRNMLTNSAQGRALADFAVDRLGYKTFAVLQPNIPYGDELTQAFWDELERRGAQMRGYETYEAEQTTFTEPVKRLVGRCTECLADRADYGEQRREAESIKDAFRRRKELEKLRKDVPPVIDFEALLIPDFYKTVALVAPALAVEDIVTNGCDLKDVERIKKTTKRDDLKTVLLLGGNGWDNPELLARAGKYVQCSVFVDGFYAPSEREKTRTFVAQFSEAYHRAPGILEASAYDTASLVKRLLQTARPQNREAFLAALRSAPPLEGATGVLAFTDGREAKTALFWLTIGKDGVHEFDPSTVVPTAAAQAQ